MAKERSGATAKAGKAVIDRPPAPASMLTDDPDRAKAQQEARTRWEDESSSTYMVGTLCYAVEQWKDAGLDPGAVMRAITDGKDPILAEAVMALTKRPQVEVRKPRQGKSKWTHKEQGELVLAVWRGLMRKRAAASPLEPNPKVTTRTVCNGLVGRNGPEKWRTMKGQGLETRYREALKSPVGLLLDHLLTEATRARSQGKIDADELAVLVGHLDRFVASL